MTVRQMGPFVIASLSFVLLLSAGVSAQQVHLTVKVVPPAKSAGADMMLTMKLQSQLTKTGLDVIASPGPLTPKQPGDLTGVNMDSSDLHIHYTAKKREDGIFAVKVWVVERVSGETVIQVEGDAGKMRSDRAPSINRAMDDAANAAGAKLVAGIKTYQESLAKNGSPCRIELRKVPLKATLAITSLLMKKSSKVEEAKAAKGAKAWLIRTRMDKLDLAMAIWKQVEENAPKADDCDFLVKTRGHITLACKN